MAKKKAGGVNKSQSIRDYHKAHPRHKPKQIAAELGNKGVKVSAQFVSTILSTSKRKKSIGKPGRPKGSVSRRGRPRKSSTSSNREVSFDALLTVPAKIRVVSVRIIVFLSFRGLPQSSHHEGHRGTSDKPWGPSRADETPPAVRSPRAVFDLRRWDFQPAPNRAIMGS